MNVAMADAAMSDRDLYLLRAKFSWIVAIGEQFCSSRVCCKTLNLSHGRSGFLTGVLIGPTNRKVPSALKMVDVAVRPS